MTFAVFAAIACAWSYVIAFLVLTAMTSRRKGQSVLLFGKGRERQALPALLFRAAFVLAVTYPPLSIWLPARTETLVGAGAHSGVLHAVEMIGLATMAIGAMFALYIQNHMAASWRIGASSGHLGGIVVIRCLRTVGRESPTERESALMLSPPTKCRRRISAINSIFITTGSPDHRPDLITTRWKLLNAVSARNLETFARCLTPCARS